YLVGKIERVNGFAMNFIKQRRLPSAEVSGLADAAGSEEMGEVTVEDAMAILARMEGGVMATFEATRFATGRRNHNCVEVNGSKGSIWWDLERMDELHFYTDEDPKFARGFRTILVTEPEHPYLPNYWPAGHIIGWAETFANEIYDFLKSIEDDTMPSPSFRDGLQNQKVLDAVIKSSETEQWVDVE
ncbi:MAG TPA: Gfo/Idh/MocA family oxidoreductase, partial [Candidatus Lokiarchaeia archaeon]|nr:Gfo/Idh/MocA family oxidoreductase [Candidatus Lokiarchaeia archaeon]